MIFKLGNAIRYSVSSVGDLDPSRSLDNDYEGDFEQANPLLGPNENLSDNRQNEVECKIVEDDCVYQCSPYNNGTSDEWILNAYDIEALAVGAGILGCGGGGSPYLAKLRAKHELEKGTQLKIVKESKYVPYFLFDRVTRAPCNLLM